MKHLSKMQTEAEAHIDWYREKRFATCYANLLIKDTLVIKSSEISIDRKGTADI